MLSFQVAFISWAAGDEKTGPLDLSQLLEALQLAPLFGTAHGRADPLLAAAALAAERQLVAPSTYMYCRACANRPHTLPARIRSPSMLRLASADGTNGVSDAE